MQKHVDEFKRANIIWVLKGLRPSWAKLLICPATAEEYQFLMLVFEASKEAKLLISQKTGQVFSTMAQISKANLPRSLRTNLQDIASLFFDKWCGVYEPIYLLGAIASVRHLHIHAIGPISAFHAIGRSERKAIKLLADLRQCAWLTIPLKKIGKLHRTE